MAVSPSNQLVPLEEALQGPKRMLARNMPGISAALGNYMAPERFLSAVMTLCRQNPDLANPNKAAPATLLLSVLRIAHLQLSPDPALGQAWIIPRQGKAEFQLGYKGALALSYRSPLVAAVRYGVVDQDDHFVWRDGRSWVLEHEPSEDGWPETMDRLRAAWVVIELRSGASLPRVMYQAEILRHKDRGKGSQPAWQTDPAAMAVKTVIGDACRRGPFEGEIGRAFMLDHLGEVGKGQPPATDEERAVIDVEPEPGSGTKPSDKFKAAHRPPAPVSEDPFPESLDEDHGGDPLYPAFDEGDGDETQAIPADELADLQGPVLLSPVKCATLRALAVEHGDPEGEALAQEAARLCGSGTLENVPAHLEPDLLKWIDSRPTTRRKRG